MLAGSAQEGRDTVTPHQCTPPPIEDWADHEDDWYCPECPQVWYVGSRNLCTTCYRSDGPEWVRYGSHSNYGVPGREQEGVRRD